MLLYKPESSIAAIARLAEYTALSWGTGWAGSFLVGLVRAPKLLHDELSADLATARAELQARSAQLDLTILEGIFVEGPPLQLLLLVRAVNRSARVTVRDWELWLEPSGFVHSPAPIREGLQAVRHGFFDEQDVSEPIAARIDRTTRSTPLETGVGVEGWLLFGLRGKPTIEEAVGSVLTLKATDDLGQTHIVTARRSDYILTTGTII